MTQYFRAECPGRSQLPFSWARGEPGDAVGGRATTISSNQPRFVIAAARGHKSAPRRREGFRSVNLTTLLREFIDG